jgi:single-stranded-DNA-specific exonuclease
MLTDASPERAREIATYLEEQTRARQAIERQIFDEALAQAQELKYDREDCRAIVLGSANWHPGVIGIVASRLVDRFHRPSIMIALSDQLSQGSGRSISGFHLARALEVCGDHLEGYGGHEMAAGLKILPAKFDDFRAAFCAHASDTLSHDLLVRELKLDCLAELKHMTAALVDDLKRLGPFGHGNRKPILCCCGVTIAAPLRRVGKTGDHVQLQVKQNGTTMRCIAFGLGKSDRSELFEKLQPGAVVDVAVEPQLNEFNGYINVELEVKDLRMGGA